MTDRQLIDSIDRTARIYRPFLDQKVSDTWVRDYVETKHLDWRVGMLRGFLIGRSPEEKP